MADWTYEIRSRFHGPVDDEVISELASYLEDLYESDRAQGMSEMSATDHCLDEASQIAGVARRIANAKRKGSAMNNRVRSFWVPSLVTFGAASILLMAIQRVGSEPRIFWHDGLAIQFYLPWLIALPLCGAVGAYLSRRAGGPLRASLTAGIFPAVVMLALLLLALLVSTFVERHTFSAWFVTAFLITLCNWVFAPALALLIGAAPVCWLKKPTTA